LAPSDEGAAARRRLRERNSAQSVLRISPSVTAFRRATSLFRGRFGELYRKERLQNMRNWIFVRLRMTANMK
jgi:hypothetical protein